MVMTMEEEVEELCRMTVARTPIIRPVIGFSSNALSWNTLPAAHTHSTRVRSCVATAKVVAQAASHTHTAHVCRVPAGQS